MLTESIAILKETRGQCSTPAEAYEKGMLM